MCWYKTQTPLNHSLPLFWRKGYFLMETISPIRKAEMVLAAWSILNIDLHYRYCFMYNAHLFEFELAKWHNTNQYQTKRSEYCLWLSSSFQKRLEMKIILPLLLVPLASSLKPFDDHHVEIVQVSTKEFFSVGKWKHAWKCIIPGSKSYLKNQSLKFFMSAQHNLIMIKTERKTL